MAVFATAGQAADWSGNLSLVTDYRFRGASLSGGKPAVQAAVGLDHQSGSHAEIWGSTLGRSRQEIDVTLGHALKLTESVGADLSATYYLYPGGTGSNAVELTLSLEFNRGPWTASAGASVAPAQSGTRDAIGEKRANVYGFTKLLFAPERLPIAFSAGLGHERGPWDLAVEGGKWDWSLGAETDFEPVQISLACVGSDEADERLVASIRIGF